MWTIHCVASGLNLGDEVLVTREDDNKNEVAAIAGLALMPAIANSTHEALVDPQYREAALVTLVITVSNISAFKLGAPFWGLIGGVIVHQIVIFKKSI